MLVALVILLSSLVSPGQAAREAKGERASAPSAALLGEEPQIPDYRLLVAQRREEALTQAQQQRQWQQGRLLEEETAAARQQIRQERALRGDRMEQIADLVPEGYRQTVLDVAERFELDPRLIASVGTVESNWNPWTVGTVGDSGLMQILPPTGAWIARRMGLPNYDLFDPETNLTMGGWYLRTLYDEYGSWIEALAAYNGGPRAARWADGNPYVKRVLKVYQQGESGRAVETIGLR